MTSFNTTVDNYRTMLVREKADRLTLPKQNFDTGTLTFAGKYVGADQAYDKLLEKLSDNKFAGVSPGLRDNILTYYDARKPPVANPTDKHPEQQLKKATAEWTKIVGQLDALRMFQPDPVAAP
jgi:hypothetical protein